MSTVDSDRPRPWRRRLGASLRLAAPAIGLYALVRVIALVVLWLWARAEGADVWQVLGGRFDTTWYLGIAAHGYDAAIPIGANGQPTTTNLAFFPLYPALIRVVDTILPLSAPASAILISWVAGLAAAWVIFLVGNRLAGPRAGTLLAVLWGVLPHAFVESIAYTETLFTALAAGTLYALLTRRWLTAGVLCLISGLVRPTALALAGAIGIAALLALWRREATWRPVVAVLLAPLGWLAFVGWVGLRLHRLDGWFYVQGDIWGSRFDGGFFTLRTLKGLATTSSTTYVPYAVTAVLAVGVGLLVWGLWQRQPWPLWTYSALVVVLALGGAGYYHSKARILLPAFTLLLPVAVLARRWPVAAQVALVTPLLAVSAWFGGYLAFVWPYSP